MMLAKILTRVTTVAASSAGATAVLETNQSTNEVQVPTQPTTVFAPHLHNNDEFIFVDHHNNYGINSGSFLRSNANSNMMMDNNISPLNIGVTGSEFNCALTALKEHPDLIYDLMPSNLLSAEQTEKLCSAMHDVLNNHRVVSSVKAKLLKYDPHSLSSMIGNNDINTPNHSSYFDLDNDDDLTNTRSETSSTYAFNHYATATNHLSPSEQWNQLVSDHPCAICQDVLAKPTILSCSHSFCGICLHDLITSCSEVSSTLHDIDEMISNMTVVKRCPTCNEEICRAGTYERTLDDVITVRASTIPSCEGKTQWMERMDAYDVPLSRRVKLMTSSTASGGGRADDNRDGGDDAWDLRWMLFPLTIVIIVLITIFRSK